MGAHLTAMQRHLPQINEPYLYSNKAGNYLT